MDREYILKELSKKLDPANLKQREGGGKNMLSYLEGWFVIAEFNRIFGHLEWSRELTSLEMIGQPHSYQNRQGRDMVKVGYRATVRVSKAVRSTKQNAYYWSTIIPAIRELFINHVQPCSADDVHDFLKMEVYGLSKLITNPKTGEATKIPGDSRTLLTDEFEVYQEACRAFAAENGVFIKLPREQDNEF